MLQHFWIELRFLCPVLVLLEQLVVHLTHLLVIIASNSIRSALPIGLLENVWTFRLFMRRCYEALLVSNLTADLRLFVSSINFPLLALLFRADGCSGAFNFLTSVAYSLKHEQIKGLWDAQRALRVCDIRLQLGDFGDNLLLLLVISGNNTIVDHHC